MRILLCLVIGLSCLTTVSRAQTITQTFGNGANTFSIDFVQVGNPNNAADTTGQPSPAGSVSYVYNIGKYEISRELIAKANLDGALNITMYDMSGYGGNGGMKPAMGISWYEATRFVNYLNTSTGYTPAYKYASDGSFQIWTSGEVGFNHDNPFRNSLAKYFLPSSNEWYKAAYGSPNGTWYDFPNGSNVAPVAVLGGTDSNTAVYGGVNVFSDVNNAGGLSAYGTMGQGGNAWEWLEGAYDGINDIAGKRGELRGGYMNSSWSDLAAASGHVYDADLWDQNSINGFRVAMAPEPSSLSLLLAGGAVLMAGRRIKV